MIKSYNKRKEEESKEKITLAYLNSLWTVQWLGKKPPKPLSEILGEKKTKGKMTDEQMLERVKMLNAMFGGEVR